MSRWRPPGEKSTALITAQGHQRLKSELDALWRVKRPEVVKALAAAAAEGDGGTITVTGSRIVRNGYDAPTPVTVKMEEASATNSIASSRRR